LYNLMGKYEWSGSISENPTKKHWFFKINSF
jgi:hypothetical protein